MDKFKIKDSEKTEIFRVNSKYFDLTDKKKLEVLLLMDEWVKTELKKLQKTSSDSDYAKLPNIDELKSYMHRHKYLPNIVGTLEAIKKLGNFA